MKDQNGKAAQIPTPSLPIENSSQDIYIMLASGEIAYLPHEFYSDSSRIIEQVEQDGTFKYRFFLNEEGQYPMNFAGSTVTKVINWNLSNPDGSPKTFPNNPSTTPETGYFIDLRTLEMNRLNMHQSIQIPLGADTPIDQSKLPEYHGSYVPVPEDKLKELTHIPENANLYIAFFQKPAKTHENSKCYSYCVSYIPFDELKSYFIITPRPEQEEQEQSRPMLPSHKDSEEAVELLKTYYGIPQVQAGAIYPPSPLVSARGLTCYVANLSTFKK
ncbi:hypothetical protein CBF23_008985 [Marinomonas agarivorans]|nr:hypothetical protein CBF23_008985 [Marinomonas agarivorans]